MPGALDAGFEVSATTAAKSSLVFDARLLRIAHDVHKRRAAAPR
jgi:hypothetical protein